nr:integrase, catalytic region, zinc finger, CCHC-type, peptidase aspartic, catalytic [Tanacetum cinerariifolium]
MSLDNEEIRTTFAVRRSKCFLRREVEYDAIHTGGDTSESEDNSDESSDDDTSKLKLLQSLWILGNERTLLNSEYVWTGLIQDARKRHSLYDADFEDSLKMTIIAVKKELEQLDDLVNGNSVLFKHAKWKHTQKNISIVAPPNVWRGYPRLSIQYTPQESCDPNQSLIVSIFAQSVAPSMGYVTISHVQTKLITTKLRDLLFWHDERERDDTTPRQRRNEDLHTELEYFSEEYDEEREMEPRPTKKASGTKSRRQWTTRDAPPPLLATHLERSENGHPLQSSLIFVHEARHPLTNIGGNLPPNGILLQAEEFDFIAALGDLEEIEEVNGNCILMANLQQASTLCTQTDKAPMYDSDGSAKPVQIFYDLEVTFRRKTCFVKNLEGVDLLKGNRTTNLHTINLHEMASASSICLMARATSTKSWLWHQRLSHLNFDTINDLAKNDLVTGVPKIKYHKEHLCPSCEQGKRKTVSHPPKPVPNSKQRLHLLHMDLYGPIRVESINSKWYILVIVDDYSHYTWVYFLRSKYEAPEEIKTFLKKFTVLLQALIIIVRTNNGTEFKNQVLKKYFDSVSISHQASSIRTPQQNRVVERRNQETGYLILHVFGALCYPKNDPEEIRKLGEKGDICFFISYSATFCAYRVYNRQKKKIMETMNVTFDELSAMNFEQSSSKLGLQCMTSGQISSELDLTYALSTITTKKPTERDLDFLIEAMYDDYIDGQPSCATRTALTAQEPQVLLTLTASTKTTDTVPTPTNSSSQATNIPNTSHDVDKLEPQQQHVQQQENQASFQPKIVTDNVSNAMLDGNTFVNSFAIPSTREPSWPVWTRNQLQTDGDMCMYALSVSTMEPSNVKEAMKDPAWIESMQEKLLQFKRLNVWVLVLAPDNIKSLTLKWLFKNKHDIENTIIRNKTRLVVRGYHQEEGIDFKESFAPVKIDSPNITMEECIRLQEEKALSHGEAFNWKTATY